MRSWERATGSAPRLCGWEALLCPAPSLSPLLGAPHLLRFSAPDAEQRVALSTARGAAPTLEATAAYQGLCQALVQLTLAQSAQGAAPPSSPPPTTLPLLLDRDRRRGLLAEDGAPTAAQWPLRGSSGQRALALRDRLRHSSGKVWLRLARSLHPAPLLCLSGGRNPRARGTATLKDGALQLCPAREVPEEELSALLPALLSAGALVEEEWPAEDLDGRPALLSLLCGQGRILLGTLVPADPLALRAPLAGAPDFPTLRRALPTELWERLELALTAVVRRHGCAALVLDVAVAPRRNDFAVLDVDPFAELWPDLRDATGWSSTDHLVRAMQNLLSPVGKME